MKFAPSFVPCLLILFAMGVGRSPGGEQIVSGQDAGIVLGAAAFTQRGAGTDADDLRNVRGVAVDPESGKVFVSDTTNNRVLRFGTFEELENGADAEVVFGQTDFGLNSDDVTESRMHNPIGLAIGPTGELWVADTDNHRILRFDNAATASSGAAASFVLGQADFLSKSQSSLADGMDAPEGVAISGEGDLYVVDTDNHRILIFESVGDKTNGASADRVLGQPDFLTTAPQSTSDGLRFPRAIALTADGILYVADNSNNRILVFEEAASLGNGSEATRQIGQSDFSGSGSGLSQSKFSGPRGVAVGSDGTLYVCDYGNSRVLGFYDAANASGNVDADIVLGQPDYESTSYATTASGCELPSAVATDSEGRVWVADYGITRVVAYEMRLIQPDLTVGKSKREQRGDGIYNSSGAGQKKGFKTAGKKVKVYSSIGNDGDHPDSYAMTIRGGNSRFKVKCFSLTSGKRNVTAAAKAGTHRSAELEGGESTFYRMEVKPGSGSRFRRANYKGWLRAASLIDGETDLVRTKVKNRP